MASIFAFHGLQSYDFPESGRNDIEQYLSTFDNLGCINFFFQMFQRVVQVFIGFFGYKPVPPDCFYSVR